MWSIPGARRSWIARRFRTTLGLCLAVLVAGGAWAQEIDAKTHARMDAWLAESLASLVEVYEELHARPELSLQERETARYVAKFLAREGFDIMSGIGGHGVVGVLANGEGPTVLVRGDMDGLPVTEATGLPFASRIRARNADGKEVGTMHACGHDVHTTSLLGTAAALSALRETWRGTLVMLAQPAEEIGRGALMMIEDGLFDRIPKPDHGISLHVEDDLASGSVGLTPGFAAANVDSVEIVVHGRGGHGARPHRTIDPIVTSAHLVTALQTIVSRRVEPGTPAVVSVGSIQGGAKSNVIPDRVTLLLTIRSYSDETRRLLLDGIAEIARATCETFRCPVAPEIAVKEDYTPAMYNDPELTRHARRVFEALLGPERVVESKPSMGGEDFGRYTRAAQFPTLQYRLGSIAPKRLAASLRPSGEPLPSLHSPRYAPDAEKTLETGVATLARLALSLLGRPS